METELFKVIWKTKIQQILSLFLYFVSVDKISFACDLEMTFKTTESLKRVLKKNPCYTCRIMQVSLNN